METEEQFEARILRDYGISINSYVKSSSVKVIYKNHEGITAYRNITPHDLIYGKTQHHNVLQWLLTCFDHDRKEVRTYAVRDILAWDVSNTDHGVFFAGVPRSSKWKRVRDLFIADYPKCEACGSKELLNVHHIVPFHIDPDRELDVENLITLCENPSHNCHYLLGHLLDWKSYNVDVEKDARAMFHKIKNRP